VNKFLVSPHLSLAQAAHSMSCNRMEYLLSVHREEAAMQLSQEELVRNVSDLKSFCFVFSVDFTNFLLPDNKKISVLLLLLVIHIYIVFQTTKNHEVTIKAVMTFRRRFLKHYEAGSWCNVLVVS
jgi:hypothetical protein